MSAVEAERMPPARAGHPVPPLTPVAQVDRAASGRKHQRAGHQVLRRRPRIERRIELLFGDGDVTGVGDELGELSIGHGMTFDREGADVRGVHWRLLRIELR